MMGKTTAAGWRTPYFLVEEEKLLHNLETLREVKERSGCRILLAQKAFSMYSCYPLLAEYLDGSAASGLYEARLGRRNSEKRHTSFPRPTVRTNSEKFFPMQIILSSTVLPR